MIWCGVHTYSMYIDIYVYVYTDICFSYSPIIINVIQYIHMYFYSLYNNYNNTSRLSKFYRTILSCYLDHPSNFMGDVLVFDSSVLCETCSSHHTPWYFVENWANILSKSPARCTLGSSKGSLANYQCQRNTCDLEASTIWDCHLVTKGP